MFSVHTKSKKFENTTIIGQFGFVFVETSDRKITWFRFYSLEVFSAYTKTQRRHFRIPHVSSAFSKRSVFVTD